MTKAAIACALFGITMAATASAQGAEKAVNPVPAALPNPDAPADAAGDTAFDLRLHVLGLNYNASLYNGGTIFLPEVLIGYYTAPAAFRLIAGYIGSVASSNSGGRGGTNQVISIGAEAAYFFGPIETAAIVPYLSVKLAKVFMLLDAESSTDEGLNSPFVFGAGAGAEYFVRKGVSVGLETGLQLSYATSDGNKRGESAFVFGIPYGLVTLNAYFF